MHRPHSGDCRADFAEFQPVQRAFEQHVGGISQQRLGPQPHPQSNGYHDNWINPSLAGEADHQRTGDDVDRADHARDPVHVLEEWQTKSQSQTLLSTSHASHLIGRTSGCNGWLLL